MRLTKLLASIGFIVLSTSACAIPRSDVLECGLPDGSKFVLTSKYDWNPISFNPHGSSENKRRAEPTKFKPSRSFRTIEISGGGVESLDGDMPARYCFAYGIKNNIAYQANGFYYNFNNKKHYEINHNDKFDMPAKADRTITLQNQLNNMKVNTGFGYSAITLISGKAYQERALNAVDTDIISAVWQSTSSDNGKTCSDPIITKDAKIYELGKSILEQSFIARPISINGKKIEANFPPASNKR